MSRRRHEPTDIEWSIIEPLLPRKSRGVPRADDRKVLNDILRRFRTGSPWANIPVKRSRKKTFPFSKRFYRYRNPVECFFNNLKQFRGIATRYDKTPTTSSLQSNSHPCASGGIKSLRLNEGFEQLCLIDRLAGVLSMQSKHKPLQLELARSVS